jgi:hypothetical protein
MYIMAGLLVVAFFANLGIRKVSERYLEHAVSSRQPALA